MKVKLIVAAAMSCALTSGIAQAQEYSSELDASLRLGLGLNTEPDAELTFENYASRLRWNGSADAGEGLKAISYLEFGFDQDAGVSTTRQAWIGVEGDFGTLKGGKQYDSFYDVVTSAIDVAYWGSCYLELACSRQSSIVKFTGPSNGESLQWTASSKLVANDRDNDFIDGLDFGATKQNGDLTIGAAASLLIGNTASATDAGGNDVFVDLGTGLALGVSAKRPYEGGNASVAIQYANEDYLGGEDNGFGITGTFTQGQLYGIVGMFKKQNSPFYITGGYIKPIIADKALAYFEVTAVEKDEEGVDLDLQARAVMIFNMDLLSTGN